MPFATPEGGLSVLSKSRGILKVLCAVVPPGNRLDAMPVEATAEAI